MGEDKVVDAFLHGEEFRGQPKSAKGLHGIK